MSKIIKKVLIYLVLITYLIFTLLPLYWNFITSFKTAVELSNIPPTLFPLNPTLYFCIDLFYMRHFMELIRNSVIVSLGNAILSTLIGTILGYGISRMITSEQSKSIATILVILARMFPPLIMVIPYYIILNAIGLINTWFGLITVYLTFGIPFATWTMKGFFDEFPSQIEEAAFIDGCSKFDTFFRITLPILLPSIFVVFIFTFLYSWNEFLYALILTTTYDSQTLTIGVFATVSKWEIAWSKIAAAGIISATPVLFFFILIRKYLARGITFGVIKG
jgi:ABC-type glycerol-3-phosphate transport system permease component